MRSVVKVCILFFAVAILAYVLNQFFLVELGSQSFWDHHGIFFLVFITLFPRLTLLFSSVATGGIFWWVGFIFAPRVLVAVLATLAYWNQNPILVVASWLVAVGGESSEKYVVVRNSNRHVQRFRPNRSGEIIDVTPIRKN